MIDITPIATELTTRLQALDFDRFPISDYNKQYIAQMKPALGYYLKIFSQCLSKGFSLSPNALADMTLVDYGGGSGFLSMLAKAIGVGNVIYIDLNPHSVNTITVLKDKTGLGPDVILEGDSDKLVAWCAANEIKPQLLIATDLIEHVYDLSLFIQDLKEVNPEMSLLFTTASNPYNPWLKRRLHKLMIECENGERVFLNYFTARLNYIKQTYPQFSHQEAVIWSKKTRGLVYKDIKKAIDSQEVPLLPGTYNTCDPATGNWTERILPISAYRSLAKENGYRLNVSNGFYNTERNSRMKTKACVYVNSMIASTGKIGLVISPFILLSFLPTKKV